MTILPSRGSHPLKKKEDDPSLNPPHKDTGGGEEEIYSDPKP